jgi:hypothetical protein
MDSNVFRLYWVVNCLCFVAKDYLFLIVKIGVPLKHFFVEVYPGMLICCCMVYLVSLRAVGIAEGTKGLEEGCFASI